MTINKSQGQTLKSVGLDLSRSAFGHGMVYVGCSRVSKSCNLSIFSEKIGMTKNIVYKEVLDKVIEDTEDILVHEDPEYRYEHCNLGELDEVEEERLQNLIENEKLIVGRRKVQRKSLILTNKKISSLSGCSAVLPDNPHYNTLCKLADEYNLIPVNVAGDGNCFFHAVSAALRYIEFDIPLGDVLKMKVIDFLSLTESRYNYSDAVEISDESLNLFRGDYERAKDYEYDAFLERLRFDPHEFADNVAVQATVDMLHITIKVFDSANPKNPMVIQPRDGFSQTSITLGNKNQEHYVAMLPIMFT